MVSFKAPLEESFGTTSNKSILRVSQQSWNEKLAQIGKVVVLVFQKRLKFVPVAFAQLPVLLSEIFH